jgi:WD40 repeat protein
MSAATDTVAHHLDLGEPVHALELLPGGGIVAGGTEGLVVVTDPSGRERLRLHLGDFLLAIATSPDGTRLAAGGGERLAVWDLTVGTLLHEHASRWCSSLAWCAHSRHLAAGDGRRVRRFTRDGGPDWSSSPLASTVAGLAFLRRDGRRIVAAAYQGVTILEPATDRVIEHLPAPGAIAGLAVAPNGRWVVGGSQDATLHGWKVPGGSAFRMSGFPTTVSRLAFEPGGRWMACDADDTIACWDFSGAGPTGREALLAEGHAAAVTALFWAPPDGATRVLVTADAAGNVARWRIEPSHGPGDRLRPSWTAATGDPAGAVAATGTHVVSGHRSGAIRWHRSW